MERSYAHTLLEAMGGGPVVLVAAGVAIVRDGSDILLLQRPDGGWDLPGGHLEPGESLEETVMRETLEETGLTVKELKLFGIASGKDVFVPGRNAYYVTAIFLSTAHDGALSLSDEHVQCRFFPLRHPPETLATAAHRVITRLASSGVNVEQGASAS